MGSVIEMLSGKKTYLVATIFILCVLVERFIGLDIPGFEVSNNWLELVMQMLGLSAIRAGLGKL